MAVFLNQHGRPVVSGLLLPAARLYRCRDALVDCRARATGPGHDSVSQLPTVAVAKTAGDRQSDLHFKTANDSAEVVGNR